MALNSFSTAARNAIVDALVDQFDSGSGDATGDIRFLQADDSTETALIDHTGSAPVSSPMFGDAAVGTATCAGLPIQDDSATGGPTAVFHIRNKANAVVVKGTVTAVGGGGDMEFSTTIFGAGDVVRLTSLTVVAPS